MTEEIYSSNRKGGVSGFAVVLLIAGAFVVGMFWNRMQSLEKEVANLRGSVKQDSGQQAVVGNTGGVQPNQPQLGSADQVDPIGDDDHVRGNPDAEIVLIEYSDFQCPYCETFHATMQQVMDEYGDRVAWVYRHFPLISIHPNAQKAAEASECVAELGGNKAFWEYTDILFGGSVLDEASLTSAAGQIGVNQSGFSDCLSSGKYAQKVNDGLVSGQKAGVTGTPGTIILTKDGRTQLIPGALPFVQVKTVIDGLL
jgi:protein-disulfide isomerase